jgi:hypothetical protein
MNKQAEILIQSIANDILMLTQNVLNAADLRNSALNKELQVKVHKWNNPVIDVLFNDYLNYIETGRKPRTGKMPRLSDLHRWAIEKKIPTDNNTLFLLARSIWEAGIPARPVLATLEDEISKHFQTKWAGELVECIAKEISKIMN